MSQVPGEVVGIVGYDQKSSNPQDGPEHLSANDQRPHGKEDISPCDFEVKYEELSLNR